MAQKIYNQAMLHPVPSSIVPLATSNWRHEKLHTQYFYGHSYTALKPHEFILQKLGLTISNDVALHISDAKQGVLSPPGDSFDKDFLLLTARPVEGPIISPPPGFTRATLGIDISLNIDSA
jgi:hypothetical protein